MDSCAIMVVISVERSHFPPFFSTAETSRHSLSPARPPTVLSRPTLPPKRTACPSQGGSCEAFHTCCHDSTACVPFECSVCCGQSCCPYPMTCCGENCCRPGTKCETRTRQCVDWPTPPEAYSIKGSLDVTLHALKNPYMAPACSSGNYQYTLHYGEKTSVSLGNGLAVCWSGFVNVTATQASRPEDILIKFSFSDGLVCK